MSNLIEVCVKIISYLLLFVGLVQLIYPLLIDTYKLQKRRFRLKKQNRFGSRKSNMSYRSSPLTKHIKLLVYSTAKNPSSRALWNFYSITIILFLIPLITLYSLSKSLLMPLLISTTFGFLPYIWKRIRLANLRLEASYAFMQEFHVVLQAYQSNNSQYHALMDITKTIRHKGLLTAFMRVLSSMQKERNLDSFNASIQLFAFTINSNFTTRFSNLMMKAYREGIDISSGLLDLHVDLRKRAQDMATLKTKRTETVILGFLPIIILPIFILMSQRMSLLHSHGFFMQNTASGLLFMLALFVAIISALSAFLLSKPKADY